MRVKQYNGQDPWTGGGMRVPSHPDFAGRGRQERVEIISPRDKC